MAIDNNSMSIGQVLDIACALAKEVETIHALPAIHGNIRPSAVIRSESGQVSLLEPKQGYTLLGVTPNLDGNHLPYISPEQTGRMNREIDGRTDLYSLGIVFYEILTGVPPFTADDPLEIIHQHIAKQPIPARERTSAVPRQLSDIVALLLQKSPEDRYSSSSALYKDLERCARDLEETGVIGEFRLDETRYLGTLHFSNKLYGRDKEIQHLLDTFHSISTGAVEGLWVSGYSGAGKSSLVRELYKPTADRQGVFLEGKYDQLHRTSPYAGWIQVLTSLVKKILQSTPRDLEQWRCKLQDAVGRTGKVLVNLIPNLEEIIGPQPDVVELHGQEALSRIAMQVQRFIRCTASEEHPLVIFLDDLQWIDLASIGLLKLLFSDSELSHTLFIGAYRDNEVGAHHPLALVRDELEQQQAPIRQLHVENISESDAHQLVADVLHASLPATRTLADIVYQKTAGNAFFTRQMLLDLNRKGVLSFDSQGRSWQWDDRTLPTLKLSDNVADMIIDGLRLLSTPDQEVLKYCACIGNRVSSALFQLVLNYTSKGADHPLDLMVSADILLPVDQGCQFTHDRIQEACYALIEEEQKPHYHTSVYGFFEALYRQSPSDEFFLEMTHQKRLAKSLLKDESKRFALARMDLEAGAIMLKSAALDNAHDCFIEGIDLLPADCWETHYQTALRLHEQAHETAFLKQDYEQMQALFDTLEQHVDAPRDQLGYFKTHVTYLSLQARYQEATEVGCKKLRAVGIDVPPEDELLSSALAIIDRYLNLFVGHESKTVLGDLLDPAPAEKARLMDFVQTLAAPTYYYKAEYYYYLHSLATEMSIAHGSFSGLSDSLAGVGSCMSSLHRYEEAEAFGKGSVAYAMHMEMNRCRALNEYALVIFPWRGPLDKARDLGLQGFEYGQIEMDPEYPGYCLFSFLDSSLLLGTPLKAFHDKERWAIDYAKNAGNTLAQGCFISPERLTRILLGEAGVAFDQGYEKRFSESFGDIGMARAYYHLFKMIDHFLFGRYPEACDEAEAIGEDFDQICHFVIASYYRLFYSLSLTRGHTQMATLSQSEILILDEHREAYALWCENYAPTFQNKSDLIEAEMARLAGDRLKAMDLYESAINGAQEQGFIHEEALAQEMAALFYLEDGKAKISRTYLMSARRGYADWGAVTKVRQLEERYPRLLEKSAGGDVKDGTTDGGQEALDLGTFLKASHAIAGEIVLANLLKRLLQIVMENAGAQKGFLLLEEHERWVVEAEGSLDESNVKVLQSIPIQSDGAICAGIVNFVARTKENVLLSDAVNEGDFTDDSVIQRNQSKSILCTPLINQGRVSGILYLENNLATGVFTTERVKLLNLLSAQMAMALDNAKLYGSLEERVAERTNALKESEKSLKKAKENAEAANKAKSEFLANMSHEIRTPMNAVLGFSEVLEDLETDSDKLHYLDNIQTSGKSLLNLINQVLDFSKIEAGKMELQYSAVSVPTLFREMNTIFGQKITGRGLAFELTCESTVPNALILDEVRLRQVLINLIGNAVKFTDTGKICLRATAKESDSQSQSRVELTIEVEDTGVGVPDSQKDKIFGAFEQVEGQKTAVYGGTGLGLAITHRLVTMMQGEIGVYGEEGQGAIFRFKLPNVEIAALKSLDVDAKSSLDLKTVSFEPATILITDDVDYNREMMALYLAPFNFSFLYAANGLEAIEQARCHHPDLILMDMKMPKLNGYEASKQLKADEALKTIPIIAVTASALEQDETEISKLCDGYQRKPVSRVDMVRELMRYLPHEVSEPEHESAFNETTAEGPMVIPPGAEMEKLHHLAMVGDMDEISQFAQTLIVKDESLRPFVRELQQLADKFMDDDILVMLEESMKDAG